MADATTTRPAAILPFDPYTALAYHFGMLLGVDDFETEQGYHLGKHLLHQAWLHREGVVWGLGVRVTDDGEIEVAPGLAVDGAGRELHLDRPACVDVGRWYASQLDDPDAIEGEPRADGEVELELEVVARFDACLARPVPAIAEECAGAEGSETAYSRVQERIELALRRPGTVPPDPYHRLRLLLGVAAPSAPPTGDEQAVLDAAAAAAADPDPTRALLAAFRRFAALDVTELRPAEGPLGEGSLRFPAEEGDAVPLARISGLVLREEGERWRLRDPGEVDVTVRPSHVATRTIQELLCGRGAGAGAPAPAPAPPIVDAGGPRVDRESVEVAGREITFVLDRPLDPASVERDAFRVSFFDPAGWTHKRVNPRYDVDERRVVLRLADEHADELVRIIARGTGTNPLLGEDRVPLAGAVGGPPATRHDGIDFVHHHTP